MRAGGEHRWDGAILIASSRDIILNGRISANGGDLQWSGASNGGRGSGGGILLRADRVSGPGTLEAYGGSTSIANGRIRVEAYDRTLTGSQRPTAVVSLPAANGELNQLGSLRVMSVKGVNVVQPPTGSVQTPDVVFSDAGSVNIVVQGTGIPDGTPVRLRITTSNSVLQAAAPKPRRRLGHLRGGGSQGVGNDPGDRRVHGTLKPVSSHRGARLG